MVDDCGLRLKHDRLRCCDPLSTSERKRLYFVLMHKASLKLVLFFLVLLSLNCYSKTIRLNNGRPLSEQMKTPNATYVFKGVYDLNGETISCPQGSNLKFKKGAVIRNGGLIGNNTTIKAGKKIKGFFDDVKLSGTFENGKSYLSWWVREVDITHCVNSLFAAFGGIVFLDCSGTLTNRVYISGKHKIVVDGCNNTFTLHNIPNNCFFAQKNNSIEFKNINIIFSGCNTTGENAILRCFRVEHTELSKVSIHDVTINGFSNINDRPCSYYGIHVMYCNKGTNTELYNIKMSDISVKGDGVEIQSPGGNYGIVVSCNSRESGEVNIHHCSMVNLSNIDSVGKKIYEDTSGIYLAGRYSENNTTKDCRWHALVHDCCFEDISKRNVKVQGDYVIISDLESNCTDSFLQDFKNMFIGAEGRHLTVKGLRGRYDGTIVKITGDYLNATDIHCSSALKNSDYARVFTLDGCVHATISDCTFDNDAYMFIYPTEKGFGPDVQPRYAFSNCKLNVKHLIYSISGQTSIFNNGVLEVNNSDIHLSNTICYNGQALKEVIFNNSKVEYKEQLFVPNKNSKTLMVTNNNSVLTLIEE